MRKKTSGRKILPVFLAAAVAAGCYYLAPAEARSQRGAIAKTAPKLLEPGETVVPEASKPVVFRWRPDRMPGDSAVYDEFRLFRGTQPFADNRILSVNVPLRAAQVEVAPEKFSEPGNYCWTVRQVGTKSKSREGFSVFKVPASE